MRKKSRAFTLVELLVVIGIIALLISVLLPALSAARRNASTVKCLSNLRQVGTAFQLYATDFKGAIPVVRQDLPDDGTTIKDNKYWMTYVGPYVSKAKFGFEASNAADKAEAWDTVIWGCAEWVGRRGVREATTTDTGYGMNSQFWQTPTTVGATPKTEQAMRWLPTTYPGKYWRIGSIRFASERVLVGDSNLWFLNARLSNGTGEAGLPGQPVDPGAVNASSTAKPGLMDFEMYRHSKKPQKSDGTYWIKDGAKVACNAVFVDGHAETLTGYGQAYKAIFMKNP
jgi:prepilin-type N-terminal cleavage/methylation domain-containing protein/prepilin-type processing-associated H-X9-DG protein